MFEAHLGLVRVGSRSCRLLNSLFSTTPLCVLMLHHLALLFNMLFLSSYHEHPQTLTAFGAGAAAAGRVSAVAERLQPHGSIMPTTS